MNNSDKIKAIQLKAGLKVDGIVSLKTWIGIYDLLFDALPTETGQAALIKAIQQKLQIQADGKPSAKTLDRAYVAIFGSEADTESLEEYQYALAQEPQQDLYNETILKKMPKEVVPFAKELIHIAADQGICLRLINALKAEDQPKERKHQLSQHIFIDAQSNFSNCNFGLAFDMGIFEKNTTGELVFKDQSPLYAKVAQLGESIGLTCASANKNSTAVPHFELRPAWAVRMKESEMIQELYRRKKENINLLAFI
ncbi:hypothetical protein [Pedobacter sp. ASV12]|uniref:hypothetical protein n=1 Tax=Pedobacter sp. ASV12 TaxID=2795120 RepID=UPI0018EA85C3|nr:hypothetical protein [Pedobacter sp. ASV12]